MGAMTWRTTFPWPETATRLQVELDRGPLALDEHGRAFEGPGVRFVPPAVLPPAGGSADEYLRGLPSELGVHLVVLLQAGASALGVWRGNELVRHKVIKKYVVRGSGRAQPVHLKTKGKSRYGSRLRLRNARALLQEVNERLTDWWHEESPIDMVFYSCPVRLWADLYHAPLPPPFPRDLARKIPLDVRVPGFDELQRVRRALVRGSIERAEPPD